MTTEPLPAVLCVHDRIVQPKYPHEILEVFKVDGHLVMLQTEDGSRKFYKPLSVEKLAAFDYVKIVTEGAIALRSRRYDEIKSRK